MAELCILAIALAATVSGCFSSNKAPTSSDAVAALDFLDSRDGVTGYEVDGNCVFVFFKKPPPKEWKKTLDEAALAGNKAIDDEFIACGINNTGANWRAYADSNTIGIATARDSKIVP